jgi:hypothetical protein
MLLPTKDTNPNVSSIDRLPAAHGIKRQIIPPVIKKEPWLARGFAQGSLKLASV